MRLSITLQAPTQIAGRRRTDTVRETLTFLPGWVIRGALASAWLNSHEPGAQREEFRRLFEGGVRFGPAFDQDPPRSRALLRHKYPQDINPCKEPATDRALLSLSSSCRAVARLQCDTCGEPLEEAAGIPGDLADRIVRHTSTQVGADGLAKEGLLFSRDTLPAQTTFHAEILGEDISGLPERVRLGGRTTTHGEATVTLGKAGQGFPLVRADRPELENDVLLVLRLISPAIFVDDNGRATLEPRLDELSTVLGVQAEKVERRWARWEQVGGWHAASSLPKHTEQVAGAGSTYLVRLAQRPSEEALIHLANRGIGLRRHEGFGHLLREDRSHTSDQIHKAVALLRKHHATPALRALTEYAHTGDREKLEQVLTGLPPKQSAARAIRLALSVERTVLDDALTNEQEVL